MRNSQPFQMSPVGEYYIVYTFLISRSPILITITISSLSSQDIEQNVSETLAVVIKALRNPYRALCSYSNVYSAGT